MKRIILFLAVSLIVFGSSIEAQVTIGADSDPHPGAILDLHSTKGFKLPTVNLSNANFFQLSEDGSQAAGMVVYNTNSGMIDGRGVGVYVWNGSKWWFIAVSSGAAVQVTLITLSPGSVSLESNTTQQFTADVTPANATNRNVLWSVSPCSGTGSITASGLFTPGSAGSVEVLASAVDGSGIVGKADVTITPFIGATTVDGYNVYCYPNNIGCWMTDNSRLGTPVRTRYGYAPNEYTAEATYISNPNASSGERGYYYTWDNASGACPTDYHLPNATEWNQLKVYLNGTSATSAEKAEWFDASELAGYYFFEQTKWYYWNTNGYWWSSGDNSQRFTANTTLMEGPGKSINNYFSVRCVKSN